MTKITTLFVLLALSAQQPINHDLRQSLNTIADDLRKLAESIPADSVGTTVTSADNLQTALAAGGILELQAGVTFTSSQFTVVKSGTVIRGHGAALVGTTGPALYIPPGVNDVTVSDLTATSRGENQVILCGDNSATTQGAPEKVPQRITFRNVVIPSHRGKRGFELNCAADLIDSKALDIWAPNLQDSQAISILNTCGPVTVLRGEYVAASENIMVGGDSLKIAGCTQSDLTFDGLTITKPDDWRTDGVNRAVKNLFELKAGRRVVLKNSTLSGSWKASQDGWAIVITPKNGNFIEGVTIDNVTVDRVAGGIQFLGKDYNSATPQATSGVSVRNSRFTISKALYGGRGILALYVAGMLDSTWENVTATFDGASIVFVDSQVPTGPWTMKGSTMPAGAYGVQAPGVNFGGVPPASHANRAFTTVFEGNTLMNAPNQFKANYPGNTYR